MSIIHNVKYISENNPKQLFDYLIKITTITDPEDVKCICDLMVNTPHNLVRNGCALALMTANTEQSFVKSRLVDVLKLVGLEGDVGTIVFACSAFDFSDKLKLFVICAMKGNAEVRMEVPDVINNMKRPFKYQILAESYYVLAKAIQKNTIKEENKFLVLELEKLLGMELVALVKNEQILTDIKKLFEKNIRKK